MIILLGALIFALFPLTHSFTLFCYAKAGNPQPEAIDPFLCSHLLIISNCTLATGGGILLPQVGMMRRYARLKERNPELRILVTLLPQNPLMSVVVSNATRMEAMAAEVRAYLEANSLDGFDIDWEFPAFSGDAQPADRAGFSELLRIVRTEFDKSPRKLWLTAAVGAFYTILEKSYDVAALNQYLDYVIIMNYDYHIFSAIQPFAAFNAPLFAAPYEFLWMKYLNSDYSTKNYITKGVQKEKLIFGIPVYGQGFHLLSQHLHFPYAPAVGFSKLGGIIPFRRTCKYRFAPGFRYLWDDHAATPYLVKDREWLSVEDERSVARKTQYAAELGLGGAMVFALDSDDWAGKCGNGTFPLTRVIRETLIREAAMRNPLKAEPVDVQQQFR